tara:strand:- start:979 stop:1137 length:159 start_codon:yes stop_codon:yes gene_type:complete
LSLHSSKKDNQYLVAKRKDGAAFGGYWEFPGGKVEAGNERQVVKFRLRLSQQ